MGGTMLASPFSTRIRHAGSCRRGPACRGVVRCNAGAPDARNKPLANVGLLAAGLAASALLVAQQADAGVVLEKPKTKKVFQGSGAPPRPAPVQEGSGGGPSLPSISLPSISLPSIGLPGLPSLPSAPVPSGSIDPRSIALPGAIVGIGGLVAAAFFLDSGFADFFREAIVKDSTSFAGYEQSVDEYLNGAGGKKGGTKKVTQKVKAKAKEAKDKANSGGLKLPFFGK